MFELDDLVGLCNSMILTYHKENTISFLRIQNVFLLLANHSYPQDSESAILPMLIVSSSPSKQLLLHHFLDQTKMLINLCRVAFVIMRGEKTTKKPSVHSVTSGLCF